MSALEIIENTARANSAHIVLPEGDDPRIIEGAVRAIKSGIADVTLLGNEETISKMVEEAGSKPEAIQIIDPSKVNQSHPYCERLLAHRKKKINGLTDAAKLLQDPLVFAAMMVREGVADGTLGGAVYTTADTVRTALQIIGKAEGAGIVSSFFLMALPKGRMGGEETVVFADCGLVVDPDAAQLAEIAIASASSFQALTGNDPLVGMLSFSTKGSARHAHVSKIREATAIVREKAPELKVDGELQFDAAFDANVGASKAPDSKVAGKANVFVFPNLDAGNIGYKIAQRIGGAMAFGPVLQGLAAPANDLSRGCNSEDVYNMIAVTVNQVALLKKQITNLK